MLFYTMLRKIRFIIYMKNSRFIYIGKMCLKNLVGRFLLCDVINYVMISFVLFIELKGYCGI